MLGRRVVVGNALERAVVQLPLLVAGEASAIPVFAHFLIRIGVNFGLGLGFDLFALVHLPGRYKISDAVKKLMGFV